MQEATAKPRVIPVYHLVCPHGTKLFCLSAAYLDAATPNNWIVEDFIETQILLRAIRKVRAVYPYPESDGSGELATTTLTLEGTK
jgi:hypothetical protein